MGSQGAVVGRTEPSADRLRISAWQRISFETTRAVLRSIIAVLPLGALYQLGRGFAILEWLINHKRRRRFAARMAECFGEEMTRSDVRRASLRHWVRVRTDKLYYLIFDHLDREEVAKRFTISNRELIDASLAKGRGVYLAMSHLGSHHVGLVSLVDLGYAAAGVREPKEGAMRRFMQQKHGAKRRAEVKYFHNDVFPRELFRWLSGPNLLVSAMDPVRLRDDHVATVDVTMFGRTTRVLSGPLDLANRCGAPTFQAFVVSRPGFRYELEIHGPLVDPTKGFVGKEDTRRALQEYADRIEQFARTHPCHVSRI